MEFNLTNLNPGVWFDITRDKPEEGRVCLRVLNGEAIELIRKQTVRKKVEYKKGQRFEVKDVDGELKNELTWDYMIVDWEGLVDAKGEKIPCTRVNKAKLMSGSLGFQRFVTECLKILNEKIMK